MKQTVFHIARIINATTGCSSQWIFVVHMQVVIMKPRYRPHPFVIMVAPYFYRLYGLLAASDFIFTELVPMENELPDIHIKCAAIAPEGLEDGKRLGPFLYTAPGKLWLSVPGIARYLVLGGKEILIDPMPGIDEESLRVFLLSSCIGALLMQRGLWALHGCAIRLGNSCMLCLGDPATGKSSLAAAFMQRGHSILSDDVVAVDQENRAIPGFPSIKLWQDAAEKLEISTEGLQRIRPGIEKYRVPLNERFQSTPLPIRWVYVLQLHPRPTFLLKSIHGMERFSVLHEHRYRPSYNQGMAFEANHLKLCASLSEKIQLKKLYRPERSSGIDELADFILKDAGGGD